MSFQEIRQTARIVLRMGGRPKQFLPIEVLTWLANREKTELPPGIGFGINEEGAYLNMHAQSPDDSEADSTDSI